TRAAMSTPPVSVPESERCASSGRYAYRAAPEVRSRCVSIHAPTKARPVRQAKAGGEKLARSKSFEWLSRAGFIARGVIYVLVGVLALGLAFGDAGRNASQQGALRTIARPPFGEVLLIL